MDEQIIGMFLAAHGQSLYTLRNYKSAIQRFRQFISFQPLDQVTWKEIESYKLTLLKGYAGSKRAVVYSPATVATLIAPLRSLYKWGSDPNIGISKNNPTTTVKTPKVLITSSKHYLTKSEIALILDQLKTRGLRDYLIGLSLILLGLRISELIAIRWRDFHSDPAESSMWLTVEAGKGGKPREVKVPVILVKYFKEYQVQHSFKSEDRLFQVSVRRVEKIIESVRSDCQLDKKVTPH